MKAIAQEAPMGCGVACAASLAGLSYKEMRKLFKDGEIKDKTTGFYNKDFVKAFSKLNIQAEGCTAKKWGAKRIKSGTIVFVSRSKKFPEGHFLLKTEKGWMNPWINLNAEGRPVAGFQKRLPGKGEWIITTKV
jgi:hypothetical protein